MRTLYRVAWVSALAGLIPLAGCSYFIPTKRHLPVPIAPPSVQTLTPEELVNHLNARWDAMNTLTLTAEISATQTKSAEGTATDYPSCRGIILMRKPKMLRVVLLCFDIRILDMASDGSHFTLVMPTKNTVIKGSNSAPAKSTVQWENLRPDFFLDALAVRGLEPDDSYMVGSETDTVPDAANKHLYVEPEYTLSVMHHKQGQEYLPVRQVTFHRDDMLPYEQYVYDQNGVLETQIFYSNYQNFTAGKYPSKITIKRPQEGIQLVLAVERVDENVPGGLPDSQFEEKIPAGATIKEQN